MVQKVIFADDLSGEEGAEPVEFAWDGTNLTIDLTADNRKKFEDAIRPYLDAARPRQALSDAERKPAAPAPTRRRQSKAADGEKPSVEWGIPHRGRVSPEEVEYVQHNFDKVQELRQERGIPLLDPADTKTRDRYGLHGPEFGEK